MKRAFSVLLAAALLLSFTGCNQMSAAPSLSLPTVTPGPTQTGADGLTVRIDRLDWETGILAVTWSNQTPYEAFYGSSFTVERLEGTEWISCLMRDDLAFDAVAYELKAGQNLEHSYKLTGNFDVSIPGTYRFQTGCFLYDKGYYATDYTLTAEFTVGSLSQPPAASSQQPAWCARYIPTNGYQENGVFPRVQVMDSLQALQDYCAANPDARSLEHADPVSFLDAFAVYDAAFFEENYLVFVLLEESSGSVRHEVRSVEWAEESKLSISIDRKVPEIGTSDMAYWHILLEIGRDTAVQTEKDILLYIDGELYWDGSPQYPVMPIADMFKKPLQGTLITPEGEFALTTGGYHWCCRMDDGLMEATIADQAGRPLPKSSLPPVSLSSQHPETVYAPVPGSDAFAPTNALGYLLKLQWAAEPSSVTFTCWPEAVWQHPGTPEEAVVSQGNHAFYAKPGSYIYEITAVWEDTGLGYHGEVTYYVHIICGSEVIP